MKKLAGIVAIVVGVTLIVGLACMQVKHFTSRTNSEAAFLRSEAYIGAYVNETIRVMLPYVTVEGQNDPLMGRMTKDLFVGDKAYPTAYRIAGLPARIQDVRTQEVGMSGHYRVRLLSMSITMEKAGEFQPEYIEIAYEDGVQERYPIGYWDVDVFAGGMRDGVHEGEKFQAVSAASDAYTLSLVNDTESSIWISGIELMGKELQQSVSVQAKRSVEIDYDEAQLGIEHQKSVIRIVRPVVSYVMDGKTCKWMPPVAHLGLSEMDYNTLVQEIGAFEEAKEDGADFVDGGYASMDEERGIVELACALTGYRGDDLANVLRQAKYQPTEIRKWIKSDNFDGFDFTYADGERMSEQDACLVWALKMAACLDESEFKDWVESSDYPVAAMGEWLLKSEAWQKPVVNDVRGNRIADEVLEVLGKLRDARIMSDVV